MRKYDMKVHATSGARGMLTSGDRTVARVGLKVIADTNLL